ncbi:Nif11-like leader peptide family natural product precursor [Prochlorococcus sp. MIT 1300]|uniref:Nif11-like leader peptide family natural product precursor n=1 Tax=Prochlorococcus sp. MIT 1300 TaxID=3096218 RepID=UPI002A74DDCC|nr:Nif11-like leader peptide family natural product precursor [Prochlorococcus sp. MIT 1300]
MSKKQLEAFFAKAKTDKRLQGQISDCGPNNSCIVAVGKSYGHKFSPATVSHWQRDHS